MVLSSTDSNASMRRRCETRDARLEASPPVSTHAHGFEAHRFGRQILELVADSRSYVRFEAVTFAATASGTT